MQTVPYPPDLATITDPDELRRLVHAWYDTAAFHARNEEFYRGIVQRRGPTFDSAHAIGDRVRVIRPSDINPGRRDYTGTVRVVLFSDGKVNYGVEPESLSIGGYRVVDSAFVHPILGALEGARIGAAIGVASVGVDLTPQAKLAAVNPERYALPDDLITDDPIAESPSMPSVRVSFTNALGEACSYAPPVIPKEPDVPFVGVDPSAPGPDVVKTSWMCMGCGALNINPTSHACPADPATKSPPPGPGPVKVQLADNFTDAVSIRTRAGPISIDLWACSHNLIPVGSQLVFTARRDGRTLLFFVDMAVPKLVPEGADPETFLRDTWLASAEREREQLRAEGWECL